MLRYKYIAVAAMVVMSVVFPKLTAGDEPTYISPTPAYLFGLADEEWEPGLDMLRAVPVLEDGVPVPGLLDVLWLRSLPGDEIFIGEGLGDSEEDQDQVARDNTYTISGNPQHVILDLAGSVRYKRVDNLDEGSSTYTYMVWGSYGPNMWVAASLQRCVTTFEIPDPGDPDVFLEITRINKIFHPHFYTDNENEAAEFAIDTADVRPLDPCWWVYGHYYRVREGGYVVPFTTDNGEGILAVERSGVEYTVQLVEWKPFTADTASHLAMDPADDATLDTGDSKPGGMREAPPTKHADISDCLYAVANPFIIAMATHKEPFVLEVPDGPPGRNSSAYCAAALQSCLRASKSRYSAEIARCNSTFLYNQIVVVGVAAACCAVASPAACVPAAIFCGTVTEAIAGAALHECRRGASKDQNADRAMCGADANACCASLPPPGCGWLE
jgi:hypothetical protein